MQSWLVCAELSQWLDWHDQFRRTGRLRYNAGLLARLELVHVYWAPCHKGTRSYASADLLWNECFQSNAHRTRASVTCVFVELYAYEEAMWQADLDGIEGANACPQWICGYESGASSSARVMLELLSAGAGCAVRTPGYFAWTREKLSWKHSSPDSAQPSGHRELFTRCPGRSQAHPIITPRANQASYPRISSPDLALALCTRWNARFRSTANNQTRARATYPLTTSPRAATPAGHATLVQQSSSGLAATDCLMEVRQRELTHRIRGNDSDDSISRAHGGEKRSFSFSDTIGDVSAAHGVMRADSGESCSHVPLRFSTARRSSSLALQLWLTFEALLTTTAALTCRVWNMGAVAAGARKTLHMYECVYEWTADSRATRADRLSAGIQSAKHAYSLLLKTACQLPVRFYLQLTAHHRSARSLSYGGAHMYSYTCACSTLTHVLALYSQQCSTLYTMYSI